MHTEWMAATTGLADCSTCAITVCKLGSCSAGFLANSSMLRTAREGLAGTGNHDGLHGGIGIGLVETFQDGAAGGQTQAVDRRVIQRDHGHGCVDLVFSRHGLSPSVL